MAQVQPYFAQGAEWGGVLAMLSWSVGVALYAGIAMLVLLRIIHYGLTPLTYVPTLWSIVFPIGTFAVASVNLGRVDGLPLVENIGGGALVVAFAVWIVVFLAMMHHVLRVIWSTIRLPSEGNGHEYAVVRRSTPQMPAVFGRMKPW